VTTSAPIVLLFANPEGDEARAYGEAARRVGVGLRVVPEPSGAALDPAGADAVLRDLDGVAVAGVLVAGPRAAWIAATVARACGVAWHAPEAVAVATDRLLTRGRWLATGLPTPWFVGLATRGDDDLDRLGRIRLPFVVAASDTTAATGVVRAASWEDLMAARSAIGAGLDARGDTADEGADARLLVEGLVPGVGFVLDGVLEQGALRVFALFEEVDADRATPPARLYVSPARMAPARQQVVAGHVARAALALGLHQGPIHATCRVDGDVVIVLAVAPCPPAWHLARALPVVAPDRTRCAYEDVLLAHALGRPLDHYGHQAIASGVLVVDAVAAGGLTSLDGQEAVSRLPWVTGVEVAARRGDPQGPGPGGRSPAATVYAQGAQPDDVIATLEDAARRLQVGVQPPTRTATSTS
jgi:hypothetical protein